MKTVKMKNIDIVNKINAMFGMREADFPVSVSFAFTMNFDALVQADEPYEKELQKLQKKYAEDNVAFTKALQELQEIEVEVEVQMAPMKDLIESKVALSPLNFGMLKFMLEE